MFMCLYTAICAHVWWMDQRSSCHFRLSRMGSLYASSYRRSHLITYLPILHFSTSAFQTLQKNGCFASTVCFCSLLLTTYRSPHGDLYVVGLRVYTLCEWLYLCRYGHLLQLCWNCVFLPLCALINIWQKCISCQAAPEDGGGRPSWYFGPMKDIFALLCRNSGAAVQGCRRVGWEQQINQNGTNCYSQKGAEENENGKMYKSIF